MIIFISPQEVKVSGSLQKENILLIHFHRVSDFLEREKWNPEWDGAVQKCKVIRKPIHDFPPEVPDGGSNYQGAIPYFFTDWRLRKSTCKKHGAK